MRLFLFTYIIDLNDNSHGSASLHKDSIVFEAANGLEAVRLSAELVTAISSAYNKFPHIVEIEFLSKDIDKARVTNIKQSLVRFVESKQSSVMAELIRWIALVES